MAKNNQDQKSDEPDLKVDTEKNKKHEKKKRNRKPRWVTQPENWWQGERASLDPYNQ